MSTGEWVLAVVLILTLGAVLWYAWEARKQAKASARMAEEMREQRLAEDRPQLLIDLKDYSLSKHKGRPQNGETIQDSYPTELSLRVQNAGRGPAKDVALTAAHPRMAFHVERRGYLLKDMSWDLELSAAPVYLAFGGRVSLRGLSDWLADRQISPGAAITSPLGVVVEYRDIYERGWVSYLELEYECETGDEENELIWWIEPGRQSTIGPLEYEMLRDGVSVEKSAGTS